MIIAIGLQPFGFFFIRAAIKDDCWHRYRLLMLFSFQCEQIFNYFVVCFFGGKKIV